MNVAAGRVANRFDLGGANYTVDAACASSLAAVYLGVRDLETRHERHGRSPAASTRSRTRSPTSASARRRRSRRTGRCRPFDADADGIAISEGFAAVVLKRLADAERDGDRIYAVIRGVGGLERRPRPEPDRAAARGPDARAARAYAQAGISPATVGLVEAHGTGTVAGDRAEVEALSRVLRARPGAAPQGCAIGSVKSMIGHTKATAGVAGLIKAALALHHRVLPPTLGVTTPNPKANFAGEPVLRQHRGAPVGPRRGRPPAPRGRQRLRLRRHELPRRARGVHGRVPARGARATLDRWPAELFVWRGGARAESSGAVGRPAGAARAAARRRRLADLAYTLPRAGRARSRAGRPTLAVVAASLDDLRGKLRAGARPAGPGRAAACISPAGIHFAERGPCAGRPGRVPLPRARARSTSNMARDLAVAFPEVRDCFERADRVLAGRFEQPLEPLRLPAAGLHARGRKRARRPS